MDSSRMEFGILEDLNNSKQRSHEKELMILSAEEYDAGASTIVSASQCTMCTRREQIPRREKRQPSHFEFKSKI
jgi:hypothetical protein